MFAIPLRTPHDVLTVDKPEIWSHYVSTPYVPDQQKGVVVVPLDDLPQITVDDISKLVYFGIIGNECNDFDNAPIGIIRDVSEQSKHISALGQFSPVEFNSEGLTNNVTVSGATSFLKNDYIVSTPPNSLNYVGKVISNVPTNARPRPPRTHRRHALRRRNPTLGKKTLEHPQSTPPVQTQKTSCRYHHLPRPRQDYRRRPAKRPHRISEIHSRRCPGVSRRCR